MTYCQKGRELILDLQRSDWLPAYDEDGVRQVIEEANKSIKSLEDHVNHRKVRDIPSEEKPLAVYLLACFNRNIRYSHAYFTHRLGKIRSLRWETGSILPDRLQKDTLSSHEKDYFHFYNKLITSYNEAVGVDLASDLEPPRDLFVEIRVLTDCGEIMTESGPVSLDQGSTHYLRRSDVEHLIRLGHVEMFHS
jgi:GINS complex subunit 1